jgi:hypothetical protein
MSTLTAEFEFEIGEQVYFKTALHNAEATPKRFIVLEQIAQRCPGGTQMFYHVMSDKVLHSVPETVLTREQPEYQRAADEALFEHLELAGLKRVWRKKQSEQPAQTSPRTQPQNQSPGDRPTNNPDAET